MEADTINKLRNRGRTPGAAAGPSRPKPAAAVSKPTAELTEAEKVGRDQCCSDCLLTVHRTHSSRVSFTPALCVNS